MSTARLQLSLTVLVLVCLVPVQMVENRHNIIKKGVQNDRQYNYVYEGIT